MVYSDALPAHGAEGTPGFFTAYDQLRGRYDGLAALGISVVEKGADPTGVADSRTAILAAWTEAAPYSMVIYPPSPSGQATYKITSAIAHPAKPLFHYAPKGGAVIKNTGAGDCFQSNGADNWTIDGLTFDGNYPTRTTGRAMAIIGSDGWRVTNLRVQNSGDPGIFVQESTHFSIDHFTIDTMYRGGLVFNQPGSGGPTEHFWVTDGEAINCDILDTQGQACIQGYGPGGTAPGFLLRYGHFRDVIVRDYTRVGFGMDYITDSTFTDCKSFGAHNGEAFALTGNNNKIRGGQFGESTGAAGVLLWSWVGNGQDNRDTEIDGVTLVGPGSTNQGIAIVPAENNVAFRDIDIHGIRAKGWAYGVQNYNTPGPKTGITIAASVVVHDSNLRDNTTGQTLFATAGATLRDNVA